VSKMIEISNREFKALKAEADAFEQSPREWIVDRLPKKTKKGAAGKSNSRGNKPSKPKTMADVFADFLGGVRSGGKERLSEDCGKKFTDYLVEKKKAGHL
jgi:hypothetical protein